MKGCRSCRNWTGTGEQLDRDDPAAINIKVELGICRRYAPEPIAIDISKGTVEPKVECFWPTVPSDAWCGEWEPEFKT